jgi:uncharacterized protein YjbI with pentapeptide repeats
MTDLTLGPPEAETPVNPYSLLEAVNRSSDTAHTGWLIFLATMSYLVVAVAGVTHKDLLLETPVSLPILQVNIQLAQFFQFAPIILVLLHLGIVSQLSLLARETLEFDHAIRLLEATDRRTHPLRLELNNFFFVQAIAGPYRSRVMSFFLHGMSWLTLVVLPVVLLLYIQVVFLPYHDPVITWTHRIALVADIVILITIGVFLMRVETSFVQAFMRTGTSHPLSFFVTILILILITLFSFFFATIPGESLDRLTQRIIGMQVEDEGTPTSRYTSGFVLPFLSFGSEGSLFGVFLRNLVVTDTDFVVDKDQTPGEPSISLRGRDLRFAKLDRSDLHQADITGADIRGASLTGADLRGVWLQCSDITELLLTENRAAARCTTARRANFSRAKLDGAHMVGVDMSGATLEEARLEGAELAYALLAGANFSSARLEKADLTGGVQAQGANFLIASLQGADFTGAHLHGADFSSASLQGALFSHAYLQAAILRDADLEGATLTQARLEGADLAGAKIAGADLRGASVWMARAPDADGSGVADLSGVAMKPLSDTDATELKRAIERIKGRRTRAAVADALAPLMKVAEGGAWASSPDFGRWQGLVNAASLTPADMFSSRLTDFLAKLQCKTRWGNGAVATGVARRALTHQFRADVALIYDRLKSDDCPASKMVPPRLVRDLGAAADAARGN